MSWRAEIDEIRIDIPEVPIAALHEIIVNSFAHARYHNALTSNELDIYPSMIQVYNSGKLPMQVNPLEYAKGTMQSVLKNPKIARVLYLTNRFESFGSGFRRAFDACRDNDVQYSYRNTDFGFAFEFMRKKGVTANVTDYESILNESSGTVYAHVKAKGNITVEGIVTATGKSRRTVLRALETLKEQGYIKRMGGKKDGYWEILK